MADWKDILSDDDEPVPADDLLKYAEGNLSEEEKRAIELKAAASPFESDAIEGLQQFKSQQKLNEYVNQLNKNLHQQLAEKKQRKNKRQLKEGRWTLLGIIIILCLCVAAYFVIHLHYKNKLIPKGPSSNPSMQKTI